MEKIIWFTGLSGSGKTTLARALQEALEAQGKRVAFLDGDEVRQMHGRKLGFSREDIRENNRLIAELAEQKSADHDFVLVPVIAPYREDRAATRQKLGNKYFEVFVDCPLGVCEVRDTKGLYKKARAGEIQNFIGVHEESPYETPLNPECVIASDRIGVEEGVQILLKALREVT
ncbi:MAG TPA: adenylyl-sulfate kinase [Candidatus Paceibacterota bacterium]